MKIWCLFECLFCRFLQVYVILLFGSYHINRTIFFFNLNFPYKDQKVSFSQRFWGFHPCVTMEVIWRSSNYFLKHFFFQRNYKKVQFAQLLYETCRSIRSKNHQLFGLFKVSFWRIFSSKSLTVQEWVKPQRVTVFYIQYTQPPRPSTLWDLLLKYLFRRGVPSWKFPICSIMSETYFPGKEYLFDEQKRRQPCHHVGLRR